MSDSWRLYTGTNMSSQLGLGWTLCVHTDDRAALLEQWREALYLGLPLEINVRIRSRDGHYRWFKHRAVRHKRSIDGKGERWLGSATDVTQSQEEILSLREQDRRKNEFFTLAAHELRNSLIPLTHAVRMLELSGNQASALVLRRQVTHFTRLIEDLVDVARVSAGKIELLQSSIDVCDLLQQALEFAHPLMEEKSQQVVLLVQPLMIRGDRVRLVQALSNLLINAAKYSPPGATITVGVKADALSRIQIDVEDTGPGLTQEALTRIFDLYERGSKDNAGGGLGVGLALAKRFVELHGGTLTAHSSGLGCGSTFSIHLPSALAQS